MTENKYSRCYSRLMERARGRERVAGMERHHILPRSLGGSDAKDNLVLLTYREHFIAHHLLTKFSIDEARVSMLRALSCMRCSRNARMLTARQYEIARRAYLEAVVGKPSPLKGRPKSEETRAKMSAAWAKRGASYFEKLSHAARNRSPETREKLRLASTNITEENRRRKSDAAKKRIYSPEERQRISERMMGHKHGVGRVVSAETKAKIGEASRKKTPEMLAKMSQARKDWWAKRKAESAGA